MSNKEVLQKAIYTYGTKSQIVKAIEELAELSQALCKGIVPNVSKKQPPLCEILKTMDNIFEEMADVEIMLEQCKMMFKCSAEVENWKQKKIDRLKERLER